MATSVDHEARRREILQKSLALFSDLGYSGVTYRQLAERCGLARTALYRYFPGKREIFDSALNQLSQELSHSFRQELARDPELLAAEKLELVMLQVLEMIFTHVRLLQAIIEYLIAQRRQGEDVARKVRRHTMAMRRTIVQLLREGVAKGEFQNMRCDFIGDVLFGILESAVLRVAIADTAEFEAMRSSCRVAIQALKANS
ncbi:MAG: TetR/AcrR family transcriptional regulator [Lentisphaeria bacterium]|nr:TetR/AcrR family transcriptional regulator [Lentisphaeria bacterium]MDY0175982.1 TetR/AcrR family transcriptional regulator [Lentisphaeria bacterium]NLZ60340.1 TetR/AcrR family transcriptional regulator [Lentisphaerota bacterium]